MVRPNRPAVRVDPKLTSQYCSLLAGVDLDLVLCVDIHDDLMGLFESWTLCDNLPWPDQRFLSVCVCE